MYSTENLNRLTVIASTEGIQKAEEALKEHNFKSKTSFAESQILAQSDVLKFFNRNPIQLTIFKMICNGLKLVWTEIADQESYIDVLKQKDLKFLETFEEQEKWDVIQKIVKHPQISHQLKGTDLSGADLNKVNLISADLSCADLSCADLSCADLRGAELSNANLSDANLSNANLSDANLSDANLSRANLSNANLSRANLSDADLSDADLSGTKVEKTRF